MNGEIKEPVSIPVLVSFLRGIQNELRCPSRCAGLFADSIEAIIDAHSDKTPKGAFGELFETVKQLGLKRTDLDCIATDSCKATTETLKP